MGGKTENFGRADFVVSPQRLVVPSRFSAPRKPIRTVQAEASCHPSARSFIFPSISSAALPLHPGLVFLFHDPSLPPLPFFALLLSFRSLPPALALLSAVLQFSSIVPLRYTVAEGESVSDCNLDCPIISCCSVAELKDGLLIFFFRGRHLMETSAPGFYP